MQLSRFFPGKTHISISIMLLFLFGPLQTAHSESLEDVLIAAYSNSSLLQGHEYLVAIQEEQITQIGAGSKPTVALNLSSNYQANNSSDDRDNSLGGTVELSSQYPLVDFGVNKLAVDIEEINKQVVLLNRAQIEQTVLLNAVNAYLDVLKAYNLLELEKNNLNSLESQLVAAKNRFELGNISRTELSLVESRITSAMGNIKTRDGQVEIAREIFNLAVGKYPDNLSATYFDVEIPIDIASAMELANQNNPALLNAKLEVTIAQQQRELVSIQTSRPPINLSGSASSNLNFKEFNETPKNNLSIGIRTSIPLYSGGRLSSALRQSEQRLQKARIDLRHEAKLQENEVVNAWHMLNIAESMIDVNLQQKEYSELVLQGTRVEESLGTKSTLDVLEAEQDLLSDETRLVEAIIERDSAEFNLLAKIGILTLDYLGLTPEVVSGQ
ncbi:MAG: TolC family protein [Rhodobacteraceae bacterium]|nr:TolC family protein [Paracoccaceae bacterium]MCY4250077.1 TolC family protein [Paracoccaceae bacterium]